MSPRETGMEVIRKPRSSRLMDWWVLLLNAVYLEAEDLLARWILMFVTFHPKPCSHGP